MVNGFPYITDGLGGASIQGIGPPNPQAVAYYGLDKTFKPFDIGGGVSGPFGAGWGYGTVTATDSYINFSFQSVDARKDMNSGFSGKVKYPLDYAEFKDSYTITHTTTTISRVRPVERGGSGTLVATIAGQAPASVIGSATPSGTVTFFAGRKNLGTAVVQNGVAQLTTPARYLKKSITAKFSGDPGTSVNFLPSSSTSRHSRVGHCGKA
jgi:hypothetical protein